jgi:hypothetical protein
VLTLGQGLVYFLCHNLLKSLVDFAFTIPTQTTVTAGDPVAEKRDIEQHGGDEEEDGENPDDESEGHSTQNDSLLVVLHGKGPDLVKE